MKIEEKNLIVNVNSVYEYASRLFAEKIKSIFFCVKGEGGEFWGKDFLPAAGGLP